MPVDGGKKFGFNLWMKPNRHGSRRRRATATHAAVVESLAGLKVCSNESTSRVRSSRGKDAASVSGRQFYGADSRKDKHNLTPSLPTLHLMGAGAQQRIVEGLRAAVLTIWHHVEQIRSLASAPISELITDQTAELVDV